MSGYDPYSILISKANSVITEGLPTSQGPGGSSITPSTLTAMVGLAQGGALQVAPAVNTAIQEISDEAAVQFSANTPQGNIDGAILTNVASNLATKRDDLFGTGPGEFTQKFQAVQTHITDAVAIKEVTNFVSTSSFDEFGSGISSMSTMTTRGLDTVLGSLPEAGEVIEAMGDIYDMSDMSTFGTGNGFVASLSGNKLANVSGVNSALGKAGVDVNDIDNPTYSNAITRVLQSITDSDTISAVRDYYGTVSTAVTNSLHDFTDAFKMSGIVADEKLIGSKLLEIGARFDSPADANAILTAIEIPVTPNFNAAAITPLALMDTITPVIDGLTGTGDGPLGMPSMENFMQAVVGGPAIAAVLANSVTVATATAANVAVNSSSTLLGKVSISTSTSSLSTLSGFAGSLHRYGTDNIGAGTANVLNSMATNDAFGEAITASLAEGKNNALLSSAGVSPITYTL